MSIVDPTSSETVAKDIMRAMWDRQAQSLYDPKDVGAGLYRRPRPSNQIHRLPDHDRVDRDLDELHSVRSTAIGRLSEIATEMKQFAKQEPGSSFAVDRRRDYADCGT